MIQRISAIAGVLAVVAVFTWWSNRHDAELTQAMQAYEECVLEQYNTTPSRWYAEHGELPSCER